MLPTAQPTEESLISKLAKIPRSLLFLIFASIIFIESAALLILVFHVNISGGFGSKRIFTSREEQPSSSWKLYENKELGFEFKHPPEMTKDQEERQGIIDRLFLLDTSS